MNKEFINYTDNVLNRIGIYGKKANQIREDIYSSLMEKQQETGEIDPYVMMGDPAEVAEEFRDNLNLKSEYNNRYSYGSWYWPQYEYISKAKVFGVPLVHVSAKRFGVAKGIIAIGPVSVGLIAVGAVSVGALSFGGLALGLILAAGGGAISGLLSFGGFAVSGFAAAGGFAAAKCFAVGGFAAGDIAVGGVTKGIVNVFKQSGSGRYLFKSPAKVSDVVDAVKVIYPSIGKFAVNIIKAFI